MARPPLGLLHFLIRRGQYAGQLLRASAASGEVYVLENGCRTTKTSGVNWDQEFKSPLVDPRASVLARFTRGWTSAAEENVDFASVTSTAPLRSGAVEDRLRGVVDSAESSDRISVEGKVLKAEGGSYSRVIAEVDPKNDELSAALSKSTQDVPNGKSERQGVGSKRTTSGASVEAGLDNFGDPEAVFKELQDSVVPVPMSGDKALILPIFRRFATRGWASDQALALYVNSKFFPTACSAFRKWFLKRSSARLRAYLLSMGPCNQAEQFLFPIFAEFCVVSFPGEISRYRELVTTADMTKPQAWYPFARAMKRKVVYHCGPTNSGKTYNALQRFMEAKNGIYCSPLRLLAMEVYDTVNSKGVYCNLHTGQEKKDVPFSEHLACTVEMTYLTKQWEVAVIDEVQMLADEYRGWAWTRAFLGILADEVHVCGDPSAVPLLESLCEATGDELVKERYERFKPLTVDEESLKGDYANVQAGDCIVAFSRRDIFEIKREVELTTKHRCAVVYGALPPETRTQQAKLFNEADSGYDVLVASDAVGMGLNLNIRRVVFFSLSKFNGEEKGAIPPSMVKQIAGRAGRRSSLYPEGVATCFYSADIPYLVQSLQQDFEPSKSAGLFPVYEQMELFASQLPDLSFGTLLDRFSETCKLDGAYFLCRHDNLKKVANALDKVKGLSLEDRFNFCFAPVNTRDHKAMGALQKFAMAYSQKIPVQLYMAGPAGSARSDLELMDLETRHQVLSMYLWLAQHFPADCFPQKEQAAEMANDIAVLLGQSLVLSGGVRSMLTAEKRAFKRTGGQRGAATSPNSDKLRRRMVPQQSPTPRLGVAGCL